MVDILGKNHKFMISSFNLISAYTMEDKLGKIYTSATNILSIVRWFHADLGGTASARSRTATAHAKG